MPPVRRTPLAIAAGVLAISTLLAACGSQLEPSTMTDANGQPLAGDVVPGDVTDPGSTTGGTTDGTTGGTTGGTTDGTTGGTTDGTTGGAPPPTDGETAPPVAESEKGSCDGFKNTTGITNDTITIGNASDVSGPVPGLFESSQDATKAFVAYFNASVPDGICGRKLALKTYDSRTDASADQQAYTAACDEVFAMVGSMSAFDSGGAPTAQACGLPDLRSAAVTSERNACSTCFGAQSTQTGSVQNAVADFVLKNYGEAGQHAGFLYINAGASSQNATRQASAWGKRGMKFDYVQGIDISEFNYAPYVQQLKDKGIEVVFWTGAYQQSVRLRQAMDQQGYEPKLYLRDPTDYTPDFVSSGGDAVEGTVVFTNFVPFEEASSNPEMTNYLAYLNQVKPGADPGFFGAFSWSAARLFVELATQLGGKLSRAALIDAIKKTDDWTSEGLHSPQHVGPKQTGECWRFIELNNGQWTPVDGNKKYLCSGLTEG
ncbi:MAG: ABC transporter substrate-binding protein [Nocardioides sp.]|nr:ABC transporter substrate-binding protein [Nocardioides sp.]